jgi:hypothetical protein
VKHARAIPKSNSIFENNPSNALWCAATVRARCSGAHPSLRITPAKTLWCAETVRHPGPFENNPSKACVLKSQFGLLARRRRPGAAVGCGAALRVAVLEGTMSMVMIALPVKADPGLAVTAAAAATAAAVVEASVTFDGVSQRRVRPQVVVVVGRLEFRLRKWGETSTKSIRFGGNGRLIDSLVSQFSELCLDETEPIVQALGSFFCIHVFRYGAEALGSR